MANFVRVATGGTWALEQELTSDEMNALDTDHTKAPNFDDGSSHTPAAVITVGGSGIKMTGPFEMNGAAAQLTLIGSGDGICYPVAPLGDANATLDTGHSYYFTETLTDHRTFTLRHSTAPVPQQGHRIRVAYTHKNIVTSKNAIFQREDATELGRFADNCTNGAFLEFQYLGANKWRTSMVGGGATATTPQT